MLLLLPPARFAWGGFLWDGGLFLLQISVICLLQSFFLNLHNPLECESPAATQRSTQGVTSAGERAKNGRGVTEVGETEVAAGETAQFSASCRVVAVFPSTLFRMWKVPEQQHLEWGSCRSSGGLTTNLQAKLHNRIKGKSPTLKTYIWDLFFQPKWLIEWMHVDSKISTKQFRRWPLGGGDSCFPFKMPLNPHKSNGSSLALTWKAGWLVSTQRMMRWQAAPRSLTAVTAITVSWPPWGHRIWLISMS